LGPVRVWCRLGKRAGLKPAGGKPLGTGAGSWRRGAQRAVFCLVKTQRGFPLFRGKPGRFSQVVLPGRGPGTAVGAGRFTGRCWAAGGRGRFFAPTNRQGFPGGGETCGGAGGPFGGGLGGGGERGGGGGPWAGGPLPGPTGWGLACPTTAHRRGGPPPPPPPGGTEGPAFRKKTWTRGNGSFSFPLHGGGRPEPKNPVAVDLWETGPPPAKKQPKNQKNPKGRPRFGKQTGGGGNPPTLGGFRAWGRAGDGGGRAEKNFGPAGPGSFSTRVWGPPAGRPRRNPLGKGLSLVGKFRDPSYGLFFGAGFSSVPQGGGDPKGGGGGGGKNQGGRRQVLRAEGGKLPALATWGAPIHRFFRSCSPPPILGVRAPRRAAPRAKGNGVRGFFFQKGPVGGGDGRFFNPGGGGFFSPRSPKKPRSPRTRAVVGGEGEKVPAPGGRCSGLGGRPRAGFLRGR